MIVDWIDTMFKYSFKRKWYETYWAFDIHGVVLIPSYRKKHLHVNFYPWAKETLQLFTKRKDIIMIMFTSSYPEEIEYYYKIFKENDIHFQYINDNPEIDSQKGNFGYYEKKFYFNVLFEDKAGFQADTEWKMIYDLMLKYEYANYLPDPKWITKY
jgi:hypothetical protein